MKCKIAVSCLLLLTGCQSTKSYEPFLPNAENFEVAKAKCQMMAGSAERSVVAWGSPMYVASAQFANSLENAERVSAFLDQCMTAQGWRPVSAQQVAAKSIQNRREATVILGTQELARECSINLNAKARRDLADLRAAADPQLVADARKLGAEMLERKTKAVGRANACNGARQLFRENGML